MYTEADRRGEFGHRICTAARRRACVLHRGEEGTGGIVVMVSGGAGEMVGERERETRDERRERKIWINKKKSEKRHDQTL